MAQLSEHNREEKKQTYCRQTQQMHIQHQIKSSSNRFKDTYQEQEMPWGKFIKFEIIQNCE